jgi:hypothetical protein
MIFLISTKSLSYPSKSNIFESNARVREELREKDKKDGLNA